jgi:hypothetical protein
MLGARVGGHRGGLLVDLRRRGVHLLEVSPAAKINFVIALAAGKSSRASSTFGTTIVGASAGCA